MADSSALTLGVSVGHVVFIVTGSLTTAVPLFRFAKRIFTRIRRNRLGPNDSIAMVLTLEGPGRVDPDHPDIIIQPCLVTLKNCAKARSKIRSIELILDGQKQPLIDQPLTLSPDKVVEFKVVVRGERKALESLRHQPTSSLRASTANVDIASVDLKPAGKRTVHWSIRIAPFGVTEM